jgi:S1/P1 Nuclease
MKQLTSGLLAALALVLAGARAQAWSGAGHQVIAAEAYRELSPALQKKVVQLLAAHPQYARWKEAAEGDTGRAELGLEIFMRASTWADEIRRHQSEYNHPRWHFIDYPLKPSRFPRLPDASPDDDIRYAVQRCEQTLSSRKASPEERAVFLSWLIHLVGDLHQPLHCASLFDSAHPKGDKGGNDFFVKPGERGITLHAFWDGLLGTSGKPRNHLDYAIEIQAEHPRKSLKQLKKARTPKDWTLESRSVAIESVYLRGKLKGGLDREDAPCLPEGYTKSAKAVAETQAALAGYRLADEIRKWVR